MTTILPYLRILGNGFVEYDDGDYVTANAHVQEGLTLSNIGWAFTTGHASNWHPLTWLSHMLDWSLFGDWAGGHHLVSLGFHIINTLLLFFVLRSATGGLWPAAFVAAFFAVHPLHVESVAWVSERKDVLSSLFFLLTLAAYVRYVKSRPRPGELTPNSNPQPWLWYSVALGCFALGLMSKPMLVTLPFVLLLIDFWPLRRLDFSPGGAKPVLPILLEKAPFLLLSAASSAVTFLVQQRGGAVSTSLSFAARLENAVVSYARYLGKTLWPADLSVLYPHPGSWSTWIIIGSAFLFVGLTAAAILLAKRQPFLAVGWFWFAGMLVPVLGLVQVGVQSMADRYMYVPLVGLLLVIAWGAVEIAWRHPPLLKPVVIGAVIAVLSCTFLTAQQVRYWHDSESLFRHAVQVTRNNYLAYNNLGYYLAGKGRSEEALQFYQKSLEINPNYEDALNNLGHALAGQKRHLEALPLYEAALRIRPNHPEVLNNLGNSLSELGRIDEAIEKYRAALRLRPEHADAHSNLGVALAMKGKLEEAIDQFQAALRYKPRNAGAHSNLGNAYAVQGKFDAALREYQEALRLNPNDAQAHNNLGNVFTQQGKPEEAVAQYREALRLNQDNPEAHYNLGRVLMFQGKTPEATEHFQQALKLRPDYQDAANQLKTMQPSR